MAISRFEELIVWRKAKDLAVQVYRVTGTGVFAKDFGLRDQIQRAAVSVMSDIAEGFERHSRAEFRQFLSVARGSVAEVRSQLHLARELEYLDEPESQSLSSLCIEISSMLAALRTSIAES